MWIGICWPNHAANMSLVLEVVFEEHGITLEVTLYYSRYDLAYNGEVHMHVGFRTDRVLSCCGSGATAGQHVCGMVGVAIIGLEHYTNGSCRK